MSTKPYVTALELSNQLRLPLAWLKAEAKANRIPSLQVGRRQVFNADVVRAVLAARADKGQDAQGVQP